MVKVELLKELDNGIRFYSMENEVLKLVVVNMGCRIMEILAPDASGKRSDVILGLKNIEDYANLYIRGMEELKTYLEELDD